MRIVRTKAELWEAVKCGRSNGETVALVPTMGNLHEGHLKLVEAGRKAANRTVVSIFVNPTQFGPNEDFDRYPRTEAEDVTKLEQAGVELLYLPTVAEMYGDRPKTVVSVKELSVLYCGKFRPGHFDGVATVVCKLLNQVQPDFAFFGEKDKQQLTIIRKMVMDLDIPVEIKSVPTVRESDGLAMSSRNGYLSPEERRIAPKLYQALCHARDEIEKGPKTYRQIEHETAESLRQSGFLPDYLAICRENDLLSASPDDNELVILAAANLGKTRLIDNICFVKNTD